MRISTSSITGIGLALLVPAVTVAAVNLNVFEAGEVISAQEVNDNFAALADAIDELETENTDLQAQLDAASAPLEWITADVATERADRSGNNYVAQYPVRYSKNQRGEVRLTGRAYTFCTSGTDECRDISEGWSFFTFPEGYRPTNDLVFATTISEEGDDARAAFIRIANNGDVTLDDPAWADRESRIYDISFEGIIFDAAVTP